MVGSRCTPVSDFTAAHAGKVNLGKPIEGPLLGTTSVKFFSPKLPPVSTRYWSTAGAVTIEIVATLPTFKVRAERPVWLRSLTSWLTAEGLIATFPAWSAPASAASRIVFLIFGKPKASPSCQHAKGDAHPSAV